MNVQAVDPVRQAAVANIRKTLHLFDQEPLSEKAVHTLRTCTKRLRAYLRTYSQRAVIHEPNRRLKQLADSYSGLRDAHVQNQTLQSLVADWSPRKKKKYRAVVEHFLHQKMQVHENADPLPARTSFEEIMRSWPQMSEERFFWARGLERVFRKANRVGSLALAKNEDELYHQWRKWVKYWLYCLTGIAQGKIPKAYEKKLKRLGESLGQFHDLCVLEESLMAPDVQHEYGDLLKPFYKAIRAKKKAMLRSYKKAHKSLFKIGEKKCQKMIGKQFYAAVDAGSPR